MQKLSSFSPRTFTASRGFTLVETVVVMSIIGVLAVLSNQLVVAQKVNRFNSEVGDLVNDLRTMQSNARTVSDNKEYGISFTSASWSTFTIDPATGTRVTLQTHSLAYSTLAASIIPNATQVVFARLTGQTSGNANATITLTRKNSSHTKTIQVKSTGVIYVP